MSKRVALLLFVVACAGTQRPIPPGPVSLGVWCDEMSRATCGVFVEQCLKNAISDATCTESAVQGCLAGRDPSRPSGRTGNELAQCTSQVRKLSCEGLGYETGRGLTGNGVLASCRAL